MRARPQTYGGLSAEQRRAERRQRLTDAALGIWGEQGWAAVTMRGVCARAGLIDRYFYESFADRDALLVAVWDQVRDEAVALLFAAIVDKTQEHPLTQLRAAAAAIVHRIAADPRRARIVFGEHAGSAALEQRRHDVVQQFTELLIATARPYLKPGVDENAFRMSVLMGIGGFYELVTAWKAGIITVDAEQIIDHVSEVGAALAARYLPQDLPAGP